MYGTLDSTSRAKELRYKSLERQRSSAGHARLVPAETRLEQRVMCRDEPEGVHITIRRNGGGVTDMPTVCATPTYVEEFYNLDLDANELSNLASSTPTPMVTLSSKMDALSGP